MGYIQMNTRLDEQEKRKGDAVFASLGLTPSDVVRAVWGFAARCGEAPSIVGLSLQGSGDPSICGTERRAQLAAEGAGIVRRFREAHGLPEAATAGLDYDELREAAWRERLGERGLA